MTGAVSVGLDPKGAGTVERQGIECAREENVDSTEQLQRLSVPEEIARILSRRIVEGTLEAGEPLREQELASRYETSRTTVREALRLIEPEGLVERSNHRGCRVARPTDEDVRDILAARRAIEPYAARRAARVASRHPELAGIADRMETAASAEDWLEFGELDARFHTELAATAGSRKLTEFFARIMRQLRLHFLRADRGTQGTARPTQVGQHAELAALIEAGEAAEAAGLALRHLDDAERNLLGERPAST